MTGERQQSRMQRLKQYDWKPAVPVIGVIGLYVLFMPATGTHDVMAMELHQQIIAFCSMPTFLMCLYWFGKANKDKLKQPTPEERILGE